MSTVSQPPAPPVPDDGYRLLNVAEVLADLPSLDRDQLLLVKSLEEAGERRGVILDRIGDLLVVQEAAHHLRTANTAPPMAPIKELSPDLLNQMGGLLAKDAARKVPDPLPLAEFPAPTPDRPAPSATVARDHRRGAKAHDKAHDKAQAEVAKSAKAPSRPAPSEPNGHIVPGDGRRSRSGRGLRRSVTVLVGLVAVAAIAAGGVTYWKRSHPATTAADSPAAVILNTIPGNGYVLRPNFQALTGPSNLAQAAQDDGGKDAVAALSQDGYLSGYRKLWTNADDSQQVGVVVYQFRTAAGATAYSQRMATSAKSKGHPAPPTFAVPEIRGAVGIGGGATGKQAAQIVFTRGTYLVSITANLGTAPGVVHQAELVAVHQYTALPPQ